MSLSTPHQPSTPPPTRSESHCETRPCGEIVMRPLEIVLLAEASLSPEVIEDCWERDVPVEEKRRHA